MQRLKAALENLDEMITALEDKVLLDVETRRDSQKKQNEMLKVSRSREATMMAVAQKVATRLDHSISHVEHILRD